MITLFLNCYLFVTKCNYMYNMSRILVFVILAFIINKVKNKTYKVKLKKKKIAIYNNLRSIVTDIGF